MAFDKWKTESGQGGRLGHSNMDLWDHNDDVKVASRRVRRAEDKAVVRRELAAIESR